MNILQADSSPQANSASCLLSAETTAALMSRYPATLKRRDLGGEPIPHLTQAAVGAIRASQVSPSGAGLAQTQSDVLIEELERADVLVIGSPMYNFGITSQLKAWFDYVLRPGRTFRYTPEGPLGLMQGKTRVECLASIHNVRFELAAFKRGHALKALTFTGASQAMRVSIWQRIPHHWDEFFLQDSRRHRLSDVRKEGCHPSP